jgi:hypothetical protein
VLSVELKKLQLLHVPHVKNWGFGAFNNTNFSLCDLCAFLASLCSLWLNHSGVVCRV